MRDFRNTGGVRNRWVPLGTFEHESAVCTKEWHKDGDSGNTTVTAVIIVVMGTMTVVFPQEWGQNPHYTVGMGIEFADLQYTHGNGDNYNFCL